MGLPRLLVFDLDGTLIDSSLDLCNSINATLAHVGKPVLPHALIASYIGDGAAMLVRRALGDPADLDSMQPGERGGEDLFHSAFNFFLEYYREHKLDNTRTYAGVLDALERMRVGHPDVLMAVLTNKPVNPSRDICQALGLAPFLFQNYGGNSFTTKKPDPEGLLTLMREANDILGGTVAASDVVMIGDSDIDVLTGQRAGAQTLGCTFGLAPHTLAAAAPDMVAGRPSEWPGLLGLG